MESSEDEYYQWEMHLVSNGMMGYPSNTHHQIHSNTNTQFDQFTQRNELEELKNICNEQLKDEKNKDQCEGVLKCENIKDFHSIMNYNLHKNMYFVKITTRLPKYVPALRTIFQETVKKDKKNV